MVGAALPGGGEEIKFGQLQSRLQAAFLFSLRLRAGMIFHHVHSN
jgi:hypothetical protein